VEAVTPNGGCSESVYVIVSVYISWVMGGAAAPPAPPVRTILGKKKPRKKKPSEIKAAEKSREKVACRNGVDKWLRNYIVTQTLSVIKDGEECNKYCRPTSSVKNWQCNNYLKIAGNYAKVPTRQGPEIVQKPNQGRANRGQGSVF
jgi:hypothetical protein